MERWIIGGALAAAFLIAAGAAFSSGRFEPDWISIKVDDHEDRRAEPGQPGNLAGMAFSARRLKVQDAAAILTVIPEDRADIQIAIDNPGRLKMPKVGVAGGAVVVDGGVGRAIRGCDGDFSVEVSGIGDVDRAELPKITARVPREAAIDLNGAVRAEIGSTAALDLDLSGCGPVRFGDVAGALDLNLSGESDVIGGRAQKASVSVAGSGSAKIGAVADGLKMDIAGSGEAFVSTASGPTEINIAGSGEAKIGGGAATKSEMSIAGSGSVESAASFDELEINIAGSGDVALTGAVKKADVNLMGSGDVRFAVAPGSISKSVLGSGDVAIDPPPAPPRPPTAPRPPKPVDE